MLQPSRVKHSKTHKGKIRRVAKRGTALSFGSFGLKALESSWIKSNQLEAMRRVMARFVQRGGKVWIRVFPDTPRTAKSSEVGMGGGRGSLSHFVAQVEVGRVIVEIDGITAAMAREALRLGAHKLPIKTMIVTR